MANTSYPKIIETPKNNGGLIGLIKNKFMHRDYSREVESFEKNKKKLFNKYGIDYDIHSGKMNYDILLDLLKEPHQKEGVDIDKYLKLMDEVNRERDKIKFDNGTSICPKCDLKSGIRLKLVNDGLYCKCVYDGCKNEYIEKPHSKPIIINRKF
jgi:hypothetical protein